jgi:RND family efflux transporter MFP subunit
MENRMSAELNTETRRSLARRLWGLLPTLFVVLLVGLIVLLADMIQTEGEAVQKQKAEALRDVQPKINVVAMAMVPGELRERISLPGTVRPWVSLKLLVEVKGKVVEKRVSEGQTVKKGHVLARIDDRDYKNALASARASFDAAVAAHRRIEALYRDQLATRTQFDDTDARVKTTRAAMDTAALNLERCTIRSPMSGVVDHIFIENGQFMNPADPVANILQIDRVKVVVGIPESDVDAVRRLRRFDLTIDALGGRGFRGERHYLYKTTGNLARLYNLEIAVNNPGGEILPDMFARVEVVKRRVDQGLAVPLYALLDRDGTNAVFVVVDGAARLRPVTTGIQDGWRVQVAGGLSAGEKVVVVGQRLINDGETVNVTRTVVKMEELEQ